MTAELPTTAPLFAQFSTVPFVSFAAATPAAIMPLARMSPPFAANSAAAPVSFLQ